MRYPRLTRRCIIVKQRLNNENNTLCRDLSSIKCTTSMDYEHNGDSKTSLGSLK